MTPNKRKSEQKKFEPDAFEKIKRAVDCDTLLSYPGVYATFKMHTDASAFQSEAFIRQN